jgi:hypothetical protein
MIHPYFIGVAFGLVVSVFAYLIYWRHSGRPEVDAEDAFLAAAMVCGGAAFWPVSIPLLMLWAVIYLLTREEGRG